MSAEKVLSGISIVIPAFNEERYLSDTLNAASVAQSQVGFPTEVLVVDNASTDRTSDVAREYGARVVNHEIRNISSVRNAGLLEAKYDLIVMIDADCTIPQDALPKIYDFMSRGDHIGGGLGLRLVSDKLSSRLIASGIQLVVERTAGIQGAVFFFLRDEALAVGGFDESRLIAEDSAFALAMQKHARNQNKKFGLLKSVQVATVDRKDMSLVTLARLLLKLFRVFAGHKLSRSDLDYWYDPKR